MIVGPEGFAKVTMGPSQGLSVNPDSFLQGLVSSDFKPVWLLTTDGQLGLWHEMANGTLDWRRVKNVSRVNQFV